MEKSYSNSTFNIFTEDHRSKSPIWISNYLPTYYIWMETKMR